MIRLEHGSHQGKEGGCLVEVASLLLARKIVRHGMITPDWICGEKTAEPRCLSFSVAAAVQWVNDRVPEEDLWRLAHLLPRLLRARRVPDRAIEDRVRQRLAIWAARYVLDRVDPRQRDRALAAIEWAEEHLWSPSDVPPKAFSVDWQPGFSAAVSSALAAVGHQHGLLDALRSAIASLDDEELPMFLSDLLDAHEKMLVEEGQLAWDPDDEYPPDTEVNAVIDAILASRC